MRITLIGAGNLATRLGIELTRKEHQIVQVYSRTIEAAETLARQVSASFTNQIEAINETSELYIFIVKDDALVSLFSKIKTNDALWVHTAGSLPVSVFEPFCKNFGVFYPLQTFSKSRELDFSIVPIYIESNNSESLETLRHLGQSISRNVIDATWEQRKRLHLAAVFACNFTNRMYAIAAKLLEEKGLDFAQLLPLIDETANKVHELHPKDAQTGPAIRFDETIIGNHIDALSNGELKHIYYMLSENIFHSKSINEI
jgi:predicted short-subunit dehydrogenase-like oxidoreductase (DUF2520 family)